MRAVSIGTKLGRNVILMATSTGATLALIIASRHPEIAALILYSPNIDFHNKSTSVLVMHWGIQLGQYVHGGKYVVYDDPDSVRRYWYSKFRLEGIAAAKCLIDHEMNAATFANIHQPTFVGYYYKDDDHQDMQVSVPRILEMAGELSTPAPAKRIVAFPRVGVHPLASSLMSNDVDAVRTETFRFAEEVMHMLPVK
jgi:pimeloyl-ACP methyl ester carboxylesterase